MGSILLYADCNEKCPALCKSWKTSEMVEGPWVEDSILNIKCEGQYILFAYISDCVLPLDFYIDCLKIFEY